MKTVSVMCDAPSGMVLRLYQTERPEIGEPIARAVGDPVVLRNGENQVDAEFWSAWSEQHKDASYIASGTVRLKD